MVDFRKLISFGKSSFIISIPKNWVQKNGLKKGDLVYIEEKSSELVLYPKEPAKQEVKEILINADRKSFEDLHSEIVTAYLNNYGLIRIEGHSLKNESREIKNVIHNLMGMEIIEETSSLIVAKDLLDIKEVSIEKLIRRMDIVARSMLEDSIETFDLKDNSKSIYERDTDVNRLAFLARRVMRGVVENPSLSKHFGINLPELWISQRVIIQVERIADQAKKISSIKISSLKLESRKTLKNLYILINKQYGEAMAVYYSRNKPKSYILSSEKSKAIKYCDELLEKNSNHVFIHCIEHFKRILYSSRDILRCLMEIE